MLVLRRRVLVLLLLEVTHICDRSDLGPELGATHLLQFRPRWAVVPRCKVLRGVHPWPSPQVLVPPSSQLPRLLWIRNHSPLKSAQLLLESQLLKLPQSAQLLLESQLLELPQLLLEPTTILPQLLLEPLLHTFVLWLAPQPLPQ